MFATAQEAEQAFYHALARADLEALMRVWADDEEIVCIHPGGVRLVGLHSIRQSWQAILTRGALRIELLRRVAAQTVMSATHSSVECISLPADQGRDFAYCDVTNLFHKGPTGWRLVLHHASPAAQQVDMHDRQDSPGTLH